MITYANVPLGGHPDPGGQLEKKLAEWWHRHALRLYDHPAYLTAGIDHLPIPAPPPRHPPTPGLLVWPTGASRWATLHCYATGKQLSDVLDQVGRDTPAARTLTLTDGLTTITPQMRLLDPLPVGRHAGQDFYLLTLVDDRYDWWRAVGAAPGDATTWAGLIGDLFTAARGSSPSVPSVPAGYGTPAAARWDVGYKPLPLLIDAALATVGMRLVVKFDNSLVIRTASAAATAEETAWTDWNTECLTGGRATVEQIAVGVPATVRTVFPGPAPATADRTLTAASLTEYGTAAGASGTVGMVNADLGAGAAGADRTSYANQAAADYYRWALSRIDGTFRGLIDWPFSGHEDRVEVDHTKAVLTRVLRRPLADRNLYGDANGRNTPDTPLVVLDEKAYTTGEHVAYTGERVTASATTPVTYTRTGETISPLYEVRDRDVPVMRATGLAEDVSDCPAGASIGYTFTLDATEYTLAYAGSGVWSGAVGGGTATLTVAAGVGTLTFSGTASYDAYTYALNPWVCTGDVTLTKTAGGGPATLDLTAQSSMPMAPLVHCLSVFPYWPDPAGGDFYLFQGEPWEDLQRLTASSTVNGTVAPFRRFNQNTGAWEDGEVCGAGTMLMVPAE